VITETITSTLVTISGDSAGQVYQLKADFRVVDLKTQKVVLQSTSFGRAGFERYQAIYSNVRAREDAEDRAAAHVAGDIKTRLAAFAKARQQGTAPAQ
jgi:LPS-assembly lipoprotein